MNTIIRDYIPNWREHSFDFIRPFTQLTDENIQDHEGLDFRSEIADIAHFTVLFIKEYLRVFKAFSMEKISLISTDNRLIQERITPYSLDNQFNNILESFRQLEEFLSNGIIPKTSFLRYKGHIEESISITEGESALFNLLKSFSQNFFEVSQKLYANLFNEIKIKTLPSSERFKALSDTDLFEKTIPYARGRLNLNYFLSNKIVMDAYKELIEFSVNTALFYLNPLLINQFVGFATVKNEIDELKQLLQRMK